MFVGKASLGMKEFSDKFHQDGHMVGASSACRHCMEEGGGGERGGGSDTSVHRWCVMSTLHCRLGLAPGSHMPMHLLTKVSGTTFFGMVISFENISLLKWYHT